MRIGTIVVISVLCIIGLIALILGSSVVSAGNDIVRKKNAIDQSWSDVESAYQRRFDVLPKFYDVATYSAEFQINLSTKYAEARAKALTAHNSGNVSMYNEVDEDIRQIDIMVQQEAVPEADTEQFTALMAEIDTLERTINHERDAFNTAVMEYNNAIQTFPGSMFISWFGWNYQPKTGFKAHEGADESPDIHLG